MKQLLLLTLLCCSIPCLAQIATSEANSDISVNGIKYGYIYTLDQFEKALGKPTKADSCYYEFGGYDYLIKYGEDLTIEFNSHPRNGGIHLIIIESPKYKLKVYGTEIKVGDHISKIKSMPNYVGMRQRESNTQCIFFFSMIEVDPSLEVKLSEEGIITFISYNERYD